MAETFLERAIASAELGDDPAARRWTARALAAGPDDELRARILVHQAYHVAVTSSVGRGLALLDALDLDPTLTDAVRGRVAINRGLLLQRSGARGAVDAFDRALALIPDSDPDTRCTALLNRGVVRMESRDLAGARSDFEAALTMARLGRSTVATAMASANLAYVLMLAGDLPAALRGLEDVAPVLSGLSPVLAAKCMANRAEVLLAAGLLDEAADDLRAAATTFGRHRNTYEQAEAEHQLACVQVALGDAREARVLARRAARRYAARGLEARAARSRCLALEAQLAAGDRPAEVATQAAAAATWFEGRALRHEARRARLLSAEAWLAAGDAGAAAEAAGDATVVRSRDQAVDRVRVRRLRAGIADAEGRRADADRELRTAVSDLRRQVALLGSLELRVAVGTHAQQIAQLAVRRAVERGDPRTVLAWAETTRSLSSRPTRVTPPPDLEVSAWLRELRQLRVAAPSGPGEGPDPATRTRLRELERRLRARAWQAGPVPPPRVPDQDQGAVGGTGREGGTRTTTVTVARLARALHEDDGVMLALLDVGGTVLGVVLGDGRARMQSLGPLAGATDAARSVRADLDLLAVPGTSPVIAAVARRSLERGLALLSDQLVGVLHALPVDRPVLLSPTAALSLVPWGLLPGLRGRTVTVSPTGTSWLRGRPGPRGWWGPGTRVEAVLGPGLVHGDAELTAVAQAWSGSGAAVAVTRRADSAGARGAAARADVLHVAAHGAHEPRSPLFSHLLMSDGPLFGHELQDLSRPPAHVVLTACELGCAEVRPGDERLGLTAALLSAGVGSVVAGVARVDDQVSAQVGAAHHRGLAAGLPPARALAAALAAVPEGSPPAPFVCFGSGW